MMQTLKKTVNRFFTSIQSQSLSTTNYAGSMFYGLFGGGTKSGVSVTPQTAVQCSAVYACVKRISDDISTLPFRVFKSEDKGALPDPDHDIYYLLNKRPHRFYTTPNYLKALISNYLLWGNGYAHILRNAQSARPVGLQILESRYIQPFRYDTDGRAGDWAYYNHQTKEIYDIEDIIHVADFTFDGFQGISKIALARESISQSIAAVDYANEFYNNSTMLSGWVESEKPLSDDRLQQFKQNFVSAYAGGGAAGKVAALPDGMKFVQKQYSMPMTDAQYIESRRFQVEEICRIFGVQPHMIGHMEKSSFNNIEQQSMEYVRNTLRPIVKLIEAEHDAKLLRHTEKMSHYTHIELKGLLRGDIKSQTEFYTAMLDRAVLSPNEVRKLEDMPSFEGGDKRFFALNMQDIEQSQNAQTVAEDRFYTDAGDTLSEENT